MISIKNTYKPKPKKYSAMVSFWNSKSYIQYSESLEKLQKLILLEGCTKVVIYDLRMSKIYTFIKKLHY